jgi:hypothetical protein
MSLSGMTRAVWRSGGLAVAAVVAFMTARPVHCLAAQDSLPVGYGSLRRDDIAVHLTTDQLEIQVLPLEEQVIRLLAPDTYRSLADLVRARRSAVDSLAARIGTQRPTLVLVTFYGLLPQARFSPEDVNLTSRGALFRPIGIVPLSPRWNSYLLDAREQAVAVYLFDEGISFREDLTVTYQGLVTESWSRSVRLLDQERARVRARVRAAAGPS